MNCEPEWQQVQRPTTGERGFYRKFSETALLLCLRQRPPLVIQLSFLTAPQPYSRSTLIPRKASCSSGRALDLLPFRTTVRISVHSSGYTHTCLSPQQDSNLLTLHQGTQYFIHTVRPQIKYCVFCKLVISKCITCYQMETLAQVFHAVATGLSGAIQCCNR